MEKNTSDNFLNSNNVVNETKIGHIHLKVRDLSRSITFYQELLGLKVTERVENYYAFLSFGTSHHDLALQALGPQAALPSEQQVGLYHVAFELKDSAQLLKVLEKLKNLAKPHALVDHGISWALYTEDPDGNGLEFYIDRRNKLEGSERWRGKSYRLTEDDIKEDCLN